MDAYIDPTVMFQFNQIRNNSVWDLGWREKCKGLMKGRTEGHKDGHTSGMNVIIGEICFRSP
ncbi:hypothetical protein DPMN_089477 [Dreissena polymorpha]|uniref:Uncharacterized protein n=1 Tax=Dreissena polymorpha TaxID=45954 RepID=A0A9D4KW17_DREPO|nr:hypothetical protein DPMN_089477 [Dreissena polymorpha]